MIHIAVPCHRTLADHEDPYNKFTVYDIHVNGAFHASVRYNLLYTLHERLIDLFGFRLNAPDFPPKKLWRLDTKALNERREGLAKYLQGVVSNPDVSRHPVTERAFLDFQVKSFSASVSKLVKLQLFLPDGRPVNIECGTDEATNAIMERFCHAIGMREKNAKYFGIFLCRPHNHHHQQQQCGVGGGPSDNNNNNNGTVPSSSFSSLCSTSGDASSVVLFDMLCVRWLKNFESPWISLCLASKQHQQNAATTANTGGTSCATHQQSVADGPPPLPPSSSFSHHPHQLYKLVVRRVTWDPCVEEPLLDDMGSLKVLYLQTVNDIQRGHFQVSQELKAKLSSLQEYGDFKQFLRLCHLQSDYGYECLAPVHSDFPREDSICELQIGRRQLILAYSEGQEEGCRAVGRMVRFALPSKRIRVWRVSHSESDHQLAPMMSFQLEYLRQLDEFGLITLRTDQSVLLSLFLQSIADEILQDQQHKIDPPFKFDDNISLKASDASSIASSSMGTTAAAPSAGDDQKSANSSASSHHSSNNDKNNNNNSTLDDDTLLNNGTGICGVGNEHRIKLISYKMPFLDHENFGDVMDADL